MRSRQTMINTEIKIWTKKFFIYTIYKENLSVKFVDNDWIAITITIYVQSVLKWRRSAPITYEHYLIYIELQ